MKSIALNILLVVFIALPLASCSRKAAPRQAARQQPSSQDQDTGNVQDDSANAAAAGAKAEGMELDSVDQKMAATRSADQDLAELSPEEREKRAAADLEKINSDYVAAAEALKAEMDQLESDQEKAARYEEKNPDREYTRNLLALVQRFPATDAAFTAGMTIILEYPEREPFPAAMDLILEHHGQRVEWQKLASGYLELVPSRQIEDWMRKMIERAANDEVKVQMTYLLYRYFDQFPTFAATLEYNPEVKQRFSDARIEYIYHRNTEVREELLASLKDLKETYPDVKADGNRLVKDVMDGPIFELEHLQVGSVAPDIEGTDFDGVKFRLSDYRGKVVMLDFWGQWCPPCRAMFPHERELIEQLAGKPFVLIGVNSDRRLETAIRATREENLVWRNFWCGPEGRGGPIARQWNVSAWPTVYLIDADGVIRYKEVLGREIDRGIEDLLKEMGHPVSL